ncbi:uncharacterized protein LOC127252157 isoform X2 [Andrographis paniculata]|uniref:uncharacterized protein LOC127252157 isoform X2 n=1 Tax=Andrographis paniculata TaxID=175694 RepID=UPI0021E905D4|nr:uncharacterized protein LOC127252157 isoform X2 [Andrographis paniculata]
MNRRKLTMDFDGLEAEDDDGKGFFDSKERLSTAVPVDLVSAPDDGEEFQDSRMSFVSAASIKRIYSIEPNSNPNSSSAMFPSYDMWMAAPGDVKERRKRLFHDMGLASRKGPLASRKDLLASRRDLLKIASSKVPRAMSRKPAAPAPPPAVKPSPSPAPQPEKAPKAAAPVPAPPPAAATAQVSAGQEESPPPTAEQPKADERPSSSPLPRRAIVFVRSRSDSDMEAFSRRTKQRKEEVFGPESKQGLTRTLSGQLVPCIGVPHYIVPVAGSPKTDKTRASPPANDTPAIDDDICSFFLIKDLDTGKDFIVREYNEKGLWNKLNDVETGKQLTLEEFEKSVGYSPFVKQLMRRKLSTKVTDGKAHPNILSKSFRSSKKKGAAILKNIKGVASGILREKDQEISKNTSVWIDANQQGKTYREFTALHMSQEIQAHQGGIWTIKFSSDGRFLASAGEDKVIHVWEVQECDVMSAMSSDDYGSERLSRMPSEMRKKGRENSKKEGSIPDYVKIPETVLALSEKPICTFEGHLDEVLDLSWSKNHMLLSSSMDETVRMWDMETKSCLKLFAHNDYVTCVQFNPVDDDYFISGSLDAKLRIWNVCNRQVADWTDAREMVTAGCYTPDGQAVIVGSLQGNCRIFDINDCQLEHRLDIQGKKIQPKMFPALPAQAKKNASVQAHTGKITGCQFAPWNSSEVLISSTGSRIGIYNDAELVQKFKGVHNTSSQIAASFTPNGKHVISASEDSRVYIWKVDDSRNNNNGAAKKKGVVTVQAYEHFHSKDVTAATTWPCSIKNKAPVVEIQSKKKRAGAAAPPPKPTNASAKPEEGSVKTSLPPLPKKKNDQSEKNDGDEESSAQQTDPGTGPTDDASCSNSTSESNNQNDLTAAGTSAASQSSETAGANGAVQASAWGLAIVTANVEGEIRVYQNFGLPLKVTRQGYLF